MACKHETRGRLIDANFNGSRRIENRHPDSAKTVQHVEAQGHALECARSDRAYENRIRQIRAKPRNDKAAWPPCVETALRQADRNGNRARARESRRKIARMPIINIDNERDLGSVQRLAGCRLTIRTRHRAMLDRSHPRGKSRRSRPPSQWRAPG